MCLAVPLRIHRIIDESKALVKQGNVSVEIDTQLLNDPQIGDYVIVHAGYGIEKVKMDEAAQRLDLFDQLHKKGYLSP